MSQTHRGKVYWVTGASGALGGATAKRLADQGARVIASGRTVSRAHFPETPDIEIVPLDITDNDAVVRAAADIVGRHGRIDGVVVSTNVGAFGDFLDLQDEDWQRVLDAKLLGSVRVIRAALPTLIEQKQGSIVAISGRGGIDPPPNHFPGASVNAALDLLIQGIGRRYGRFGIRANTVAPGPIRTPRYEQMEKTAGKGSEADPYSKIALGGPGEADDVADAVSYLLSDASRFVNASKLAVDGGGPGYPN
ncbi:SDR family oxidoreductase [Robbsia sp. KACC 23696]|uniref:SDR family NAD(P)-dependent oxidoreductase n=1 Tax=Robbsia sp. KACC 23696 TaxID=3149231 RepID=UPI00325B5EE2